MVFAQNNPLSQSEGTDLKEKVDAALRKGVAFFHSVNTQGGYVYFVTPDLTLKWGEVP